jgi:hypothetical protein
MKSHGLEPRGGMRSIPTTQALAFLGAILLFWYSIRSYTGSGWLAFAFAAPLYYASIWRLVARIQPDFLAAALALVSVSLLILIASRPGVRLLWIALTLAVFTAYLVRPTYVFLVALIPVMGVVLRLALENRRLARSLFMGLGLLAATALPFLSFSTLRWVLVGDFGLVSFGGYNLIGVTASLLDQDLVDELSRNQALAEDILRDREGRNWSPMPLGGDTGIWYSQHNPNVWRISAVHAARRLQVDGPSDDPGDLVTPHPSMAVNRVFKQLSWDIIRKKPLHYAHWVRYTLAQTLTRTTEEPGVRWPAILIAVSLPVALFLRRAGLAPERSDAAQRRDRLLALLALGLAFFAVHATTVALVNLTYSRFLYAAALLLPPVLCGVLFEIWRSISTTLAQRGVHKLVVGSVVAFVLVMVAAPSARHLYRGAVTRTTIESVSNWLSRNARALDHRTIATETPALKVRARGDQRHILVPLQFHSRELSELSPSSLDLADYEVFPQSRLDGPRGDFYTDRIERVGTTSILVFEPQVFRRTGPAVVILSHPWRAYGARAQGKTTTPHPISWRRRAKRRLRTTLPSRFWAGQVISLDATLSPEQVRDCELRLDAERVELYANRRGIQRPLYMTPRKILKNRRAELLFECPDAAQVLPEPTVSVIRWLPSRQSRKASVEDVKAPAGPTAD